MSFHNKHHFNPDFLNHLVELSENEKDEQDAKLLMFRFLSELERLQAGFPLKKKDLAEKIGTSPSYITQLFNGDRIINLTTLAKIQKAYNIQFEIKGRSNDCSYEENSFEDFFETKSSKRIHFMSVNQFDCNSDYEKETVIRKLSSAFHMAG